MARGLEKGEAQDMEAEEGQQLDQLGSLGERTGHLKQGSKAGRLDRLGYRREQSTGKGPGTGNLGPRLGGTEQAACNMCGSEMWELGWENVGF